MARTAGHITIGQIGQHAVWLPISPHPFQIDGKSTRWSRGRTRGEIFVFFIQNLPLLEVRRW